MNKALHFDNTEWFEARAAWHQMVAEKKKKSLILTLKKINRVRVLD